MRVSVRINMPSEQNRNKIYTVLVLCIGIIVSVWLIQKKPANALVQKNTSDTITVGGNDIQGEATTDWKNILTTVHASTTSVTGGTFANTFDGNTITAQLAKDFFSQYLITVKDGQPLTSAKAEEISTSVLSVPDYTQAKAVVYVPANIRINKKTDAETVKLYHEKLNSILKASSERIQGDPIAILTSALQNQDEKALAKLDPFITIGRNLIKNLLILEVPANIVGAHVLLLNTFSSVLADVEAMRLSFDDPVKALPALGKYQEHMANLQVVLRDIESLLNQKSK